ncbi:hypothetical protein [Rhodopirellula sp. MGV]|uniref:hypothetical protein n=1 Tax=Rhodopirellula sp. MGV TaxID=2023130 RepID=UPI000B96CE5E|nr:hypothetical protein [Rhodopirellula sp. MGV]OYP35626.1 hypothetical protein CGZ80_11155 [Rhodopirellula sp. MGV]PNY34037.1 hypothetical protein C2E31_25390 [Rhodopirellula baltica]PNY35646.1 hypothetical protein C2E31_17065 [Rhodopirellula baltica]
MNAITKRRLVRIAAISVAFVVGWFALSLTRTIREIPEAYAAWDTGTLLTTYMDQSDGKWPSSWDELSTVIGEEQPMLFARSDSDGNPISKSEYIEKLRSMIKIDWSFDPVPGTLDSPVTRIDGGKFRTVWVGAEPNEMVRSFIAHRKNTQNATGSQ